MTEREEMHAEEMAKLGDPRRCPVHPWVKTSSPDGMHDAPCGECEAEMEMSPEELMRKRVFASLDNAVENGYELIEWPARSIVEDLGRYDPDFEDVDPKEIIPHVEEWLKSKGRSENDHGGGPTCHGLE